MHQFYGRGQGITQSKQNNTGSSAIKRVSLRQTGYKTIDEFGNNMFKAGWIGIIYCWPEMRETL